MHTIINRIEERFSTNLYNGLETIEPFAVVYGTIPVLISAPHAVNHYRNGEVKYADLYTGSLALIIQKITGCFCIFSQSFCEEDPNYIEGGKYKQAVRKLVEECDIKVVIDIHGSSSSAVYDVEFGTARGNTLPDQLLFDIVNIFKQNRICEIHTNNKFCGAGPNTVNSFIHKMCGVKSMQIELNGKFRDPRTEKFIRTVFSLKQTVEYLYLQVCLKNLEYGLI